jgi:predicted ribosomally synthesized peptide with SipW-like signal peptide
MKKKLIVVSTILLVALLIAGGSMAWFSDKSDEAVNEFKLGTVKVKVVEPGFEDLENVEATKYDKNVQVKSLGTKKTYVKVRLVPQWSNPSLPVSNVSLNLSNNGDWTTKQSDGYYYFKYYLTEDQLTSLLLESVTFSNLGPEHEGQTFSLKVVAEGVQITHEGWKDVWGLSSLPFTPDQPWTP